MAVHRHPHGPRRLARPDPGAADPAFLADALAGLRASAKSLPCKYFYDAAGSALFDRICELPEYYPTRTELGVMREHAPEMGALLGPGCQVVEYGSGSSVKTRYLLDHLPRPAVYVPVDVSAAHLMASAAGIARRFPELDVSPVVADFTRPFELPPTGVPVRRRVVYFPGSTVGNFSAAAAASLLRGIRERVGPGGALLIGVDLKKDPAVLVRAYDDAAGVTAAFNLNLLTRINRELGADFDLTKFRHRATYNAAAGRVEMHLVSTEAQTVRLAEHTLAFAAGEAVHTENSHKYTPAEFDALAVNAGLRGVKAWMDAGGLFSVRLYVG